MLNPGNIKVLGLTFNDEDTEMLQASLVRFPASVINTAKLQQTSADFMGDLKSNFKEVEPHIVVLFVEEADDASRLLQLVKEIANRLGLVHCYWVAITRDSGHDALTEKLGDFDAESIFFAPFTVEQITLNLCTGYHTHDEQAKLEEQYKRASETARTAMEAASEIGLVMQLVEGLGQTGSYDDVSQKLFKVFEGLNIESYLQIYDGHDTYVFSQKPVNDSVKRILENAMVSEVRIIEHKRLLLLHLDYVILMVTNAPWQDAARYGRIKDLVCQIGPVLEARVRTIMVNNLIEEQHDKVMGIMNMMRQLSTDTQNNTRQIMHDLSGRLEVAAMSLDLNEEQEEHLLGLSSGALDSLELLYRANDALEFHFTTLMTSITRVRELTSEQMKSPSKEEDGGDSVELF